MTSLAIMILGLAVWLVAVEIKLASLQRQITEQKTTKEADTYD